MEKHTDEYQFLSKMCDKLRTCEFDSIKLFFHVPCVVVNNQHKHIFNTQKELERWLTAYCQRLHVESADDFEFTLRKTVPMSSAVGFSQVNLKGLKIHEEHKVLDVSFTLSKDVNDSLKIVVVVLDEL